MSAESRFILSMRQDKHACFIFAKKMAAAANAKGLYEYVVNEIPVILLSLPTGAVTEANAAKVMNDTAKFRDQQEKVATLTFTFTSWIHEEVISMIMILMKHELIATLDCRDIYQGFVKSFCSLTEEQYASNLELLRRAWKEGMSIGKHIIDHMNVRAILDLARTPHPQEMQIEEMLHTLRELSKAEKMGHVMRQIATEFKALEGVAANAKFRTYCNLLVVADEERRFGAISPLAGTVAIEKIKTVEEPKLSDTQIMLDAINKLVAATTAAAAKKSAPAAGGKDAKDNRTARDEAYAMEIHAKYGNGKYPPEANCPAHPGNAKRTCSHSWRECKLFSFVPSNEKKK